MTRRPRIVSRLAGLALLLLALPLLAGGDVAENDLEKNVRRLLRWKQDPEHYARLKRDYRAFLALPPERQDQLRRLDQSLADLPAEAEQRLLRVLERYGAFVETLSEADRERLRSVTGKERLALIDQLRQQRWFEQLPYQLREDLSKLPEEKRREELARIAKEDQRRKWLLTSDLRKRPLPGFKEKSEPFPVRPTQLSQYPHEVLNFFEFHIRDRLTPEDLKHLGEAEGKVAPLAREIQRLAEKYPVLPPFESRLPVASWKELPQDWKKALPLQKLEKDKKGIFKREVQPHDGKWPEFALNLVRVATSIDEKAKDLSPLGPSRPVEYSAEVLPVLKKLPEPDLKALQAHEGKWPDHTLKLHELARKNSLHLPGMSLPGAKVAWDALLREEK